MDLVLGVIGLCFAMAVNSWAVVKYLISRQDNHKNEVNANVLELHKRVNYMKDDLSAHYVKRVDLDRDLAGLKELILSVKSDTHTMTERILTKIDKLEEKLATYPSSGNTNS